MFFFAAAPTRCLIVSVSLLAAPLVLAPIASAQAAAPPAAAELRVFDPALVDKAIDPCENFYRYSCNGWFKRNPLPPDQTS